MGRGCLCVWARRRALAPPGHPINFAPSLTFGRLLTRHGLRQHSFVCIWRHWWHVAHYCQFSLWDALLGASSRRRLASMGGHRDCTGARAFTPAV